ncbi:unnamed protein product [Ixodes pacificus]
MLGESDRRGHPAACRHSRIESKVPAGATVSSSLLQLRPPPAQQHRPYRRCSLQEPRHAVSFSSCSLRFGRPDLPALDTDGERIVLLDARRRRESVAMCDGLRSTEHSVGRYAGEDIAALIGGGSQVSVAVLRAPSNDLTSSEQLVIDYLMADVTAAAERERVGNAPDGLSSVAEETRASRQSVAVGADDKIDDVRVQKMGASALWTPSTFTFVLLLAVLTCDVLLAVQYYQERTLLCLTTLVIMHAPSVIFFVARVHFIVAQSTVSEKFMRGLVIVWYVVTFPLLHFLPLLTLSSSLFDKTLMILGDPSDMRPFIVRQEEVAFEDLVWVAVVHCFPQAVLQLYLLLFETSPQRVVHDYAAILQAVTSVCCILLIACVATFYTKYVRVRADEETDESTTYETVLGTYDDSGTAHFLKFTSWTFIAAARVSSMAALLSVYSSPALLSLAFLHIPVVLCWSTTCRTTYNVSKFLGDLALGLMTMLFLVEYRGLNREGLATAMSTVVFLCSTFLENSVFLALAYFLSRTLQTVLFVVIGAHYVAMTCGVFLLLCHFRLRSHKADYVF